MLVSVLLTVLTHVCRPHADTVSIHFHTLWAHRLLVLWTICSSLTSNVSISLYFKKDQIFSNLHPNLFQFFRFCLRQSTAATYLKFGRNCIVIWDLLLILFYLWPWKIANQLRFDRVIIKFTTAIFWDTVYYRPTMHAAIHNHVRCKPQG